MPFEVHPTPAKGKDGRNIVYVRPAMRDKLLMKGVDEELAKHLKASDVPNLKQLGEALKALKWPRGGVNGQRGYYLRLRRQPES